MTGGHCLPASTRLWGRRVGLSRRLGRGLRVAITRWVPEAPGRRSARPGGGLKPGGQMGLGAAAVEFAAGDTDPGRAEARVGLKP